MRPTKTKVAVFPLSGDADHFDLWLESEIGLWVQEHGTHMSYHMEVDTDNANFSSIIEVELDTETYIKYKLMWPENEIQSKSSN
jgi:hypothetical protein